MLSEFILNRMFLLHTSVVTLIPSWILTCTELKGTALFVLVSGYVC